MRDKWRYIYFPEWALDDLVHTACEEDKIINALDGNDNDEEEFDFDAYDILGKLSDKEARVIDSILYSGKTFAATGKEMGLSKQRIHQLYKMALTKLKGEIKCPARTKQ